MNVIATCGAALVAVVLSPALYAHPWQALYGDDLLFDVYRDGERVGQYRTQFRGDGEQWWVEATMELEITWLFWRYRYHYQGIEEWHNGQLARLRVAIDQNGKQEQHLFERRGTWLQNNEGMRIALPILPTHHYDAAVIDSDRVMNTLTGRVNRVQVSPSGVEPREVGGQTIYAQRYSYSGDLTQTEVWYDPEGRWVGLQFVDQHGANMEFRCRRCAAEASR